jgi:hypothetical protein
MDALFHLSGLLSPLYATVLNFFTGLRRITTPSISVGDCTILSSIAILRKGDVVDSLNG